MPNSILSRTCLHQASESVCMNAAMTLGITVSLATMVLLDNGVATHFGVTPLWSMRTLSHRSVDED